MTKCERPQVTVAVLLAVLALLHTFGRSRTAQARDRLPLEKKDVEIGQPAPVSAEFEGYDKNGNPIY